jgi:hypothetical protein
VASGGVPAACIANGVAADCECPLIRNIFAFGVSASGSPPVCDTLSDLTVNTTVYAYPHCHAHITAIDNFNNDPVCEARPLCNRSLGLCFEPPGPAGGSKQCNDARQNDCTIFSGAPPCGGAANLGMASPKLGKKEAPGNLKRPQR